MTPQTADEQRLEWEEQRDIRAASVTCYARQWPCLPNKTQQSSTERGMTVALLCSVPISTICSGEKRQPVGPTDEQWPQVPRKVTPVTAEPCCLGQAISQFSSQCHVVPKAPWWPKRVSLCPVSEKTKKERKISGILGVFRHFPYILNSQCVGQLPCRAQVSYD